MQKTSALSAFITVFLVVSTVACNSASAPTAVPPTAAPPTAPPPTAIPPTLAPTKPPPPTPAPTEAPAPTAAATENTLENFVAAKFDAPTKIDNDWMPLKPGMRYVYEGSTTTDDGSLVPHRIEIHVTDLTKVIGGVPSLATWDLDFSNNVLAEAELAFFAQDNEGNVWRMGEYPEVYEGGKLVEAPSWIHGFQDAQAGIMMPANPKTGTPSYSQGWGPAVKWTDRGQVDQMGQKTCVPVKCYEDVLIIAETSQSETDAQQLKYWANGVGNVKVGWRGDGEKTKEVLELTKLEQLEGKALDAVRAEALKLEKSAYENSKEVYAKTPPLVSLSGAALPEVAASAVVSNVIPQDLLTLEVQIEDILDVVPAGDWAKVSEDIANVSIGWAAFQKQVAKAGASQSLQDAFSQKLEQVKIAANAKDAAATMQSTNDLTAIVVDMYDVYHPAEPTDLGRLDVLERQVILDVDNKDFAAATNTLAKVTTTWERVKPFMLAHNAAEIATQFEKSLAVQASGLKAQDGSAVKTEALNALEIVDALEKAAA